jgi:hypothetical protein
MKLSVWETYVPRKDSTIVHFDLPVPYNLKEKENRGEFLSVKPFNTKGIYTKEYTRCHMEEASDTIVAATNKKGYCIIGMENCQ